MNIRPEAIVRPYQQGDVFTARVLPPVQPAADDLPPVVIYWGGPIQLLCKAIGVQKILFGVQHKEISRRTSTVRVHNPSDTTQFVDVQRIEQMITQDENNRKYTWQFNPPAGT